MMQMKKWIAALLALAITMSLAACGAPAAQKESAQSNKIPEKVEDMDREDKELIADLIGGKDGSDLTDEELDELIKDLIGETEDTSGIVNLGNKPQDKKPTVDTTDAEGVYNEDGAMTVPFDQAYPEAIEQNQVQFSGESILVKLESDKLTDRLKKAGIGALQQIVPLKGAAWYEAKLTSGTDPKKALAAVRELDEVLLAEYNYEIKTAALDDYKHFDKDKDEEFKKNGHNKDQWHFHHCGIVDGYEEMEKDGGDSSVIVAVIDSGVDYDHEDLKDNMWVNAKEIPDNGRDDDGNGYIDDYYGVDIIAGRGNGGDTNGHGTHVAGIIAARNNNVGVMGIAYNVKIMSVKAAMHNGTLNQADIAKAVLYAYENGAEVINMSFGGSACSIAVQDALATAYTRCVLVASAGNSGYPNEPTPTFPIPLPNYPAALTYVLGVMSVDQNGVESVFTNWDAKAFNGVEYELYAPGENIMSTLPGNKYGYLSGTSMAAPVVSAFAAILRSEFSDRDKYPTKFIYGQLSSTSEYYADCVNPDQHGIHNLPQIVDLNAALTKLPKPEVHLQDYALFDDPKYSDKNNGDGVIDAGETIALGLVLRNRWGMSENTMVSIDTVSSISGLADPYFTIKNPSVDYGSVGTYSTQDCGRIYTDELFTGWENPFIIEVSPDCPNDYRFTLNVVIRCENALDEEDDTLYVFGDDPLDPPTLAPFDPMSVDENVRAGFILPSIIDKDMVLTPDNLYVIPNGTIITEGTTVKVLPGTHIQFWSDDADDPYADKYIAYLLVNGKFLVEGTKEKPVYIYPSQLMDRYGVEMGSSSKGYVSLKYADITNFACMGNQTGTYNNIDLADHCTFRVNYTEDLRSRYVENGNVKTMNGIYGYTIGRLNAKDCVFYKIGGHSGSNVGEVYLLGNMERCIFTQCGIVLTKNGYEGASYKNCVFLKNAMVDQTEPDVYMNSSASIGQLNLPGEYDLKQNRLRTFYRPETGTTYVAWEYGNSQFADYLREAFGSGYLKIETADENEWLYKNVNGLGNSCFSALISWDKLHNCYVWGDGTPLDLELFPNADVKLDTQESYNISIENGKLQNEYGPAVMFEIPGQILPEDITFQEYAVDLDLESTYQLSPRNTPVQLTVADFCYESSDASVVTVSDKGLVTPVSLGTADVWVWSLDKAVRNRVTFTVKEYVPLEGLTLQTPAAELAVGENLPLQCTLTPVNTTRNNVVYTSSDEGIARVDAGGIVTGVASGKVTITATCEGFTDTVELTVYQKATSLQLGNVAMSASLENATVALPEVVTDAGAQPVLTWRSTDPNVAAIEDGELILKSLGTTSVIVTDSRSGLSAACLVVVAETESAKVRKMEMGNGRNAHYVLLEDGSLYQWDISYRTVPTCVATGVQDFDANSDLCAILLEDGTIKYYFMQERPDFSWMQSYFQGQKIKDIAYQYFNGEKGNFYVVTEEGNAYAWGADNGYGQLGVGVTGAVDTPMLVNLENVVDIEACGNTIWFLTGAGELYATGDLHYTTSAVPVLMDTGVTQICATDGNRCTYISDDGRWTEIDLSFSSFNSLKIDVHSVDLLGLDQIDLPYTNGYEGIGIRDGKVYTFRYNSSELTEVPGITDATAVFTYAGTHYIATEDGMLFGLGYNSMESNNMAGFSNVNPVTVPVLIPLVSLPEEELTVTDSNLQEGILSEDTLQLTFNKSIQSMGARLYADGLQVTMGAAIDDHNHLRISRSSGFVPGVTYELVFESGALHAAGGVTNAEEIRIAFTWQPSGEDAPETDGDTTEPTEEKVVYKSILDESVQRVMTPKSLLEKLNAFIEKTQYNPSFNGNVILNPISTDFEVSHWLRFQASEVTVGEYGEIPLGGNYWGSVNDRAIGLQMIDYTDFPNYARFMYNPILTEAPENTFPFVTSVKLFNKYGEEVTTVGNEEVTFQVKFNRDMDTSIDLLVRFGSAFPYGDYEIAGQYVDARTWEGTYTLNTLIENGYQYFSISNGCSATEDLPLQWDQYRFFFEIDTTAAQALLMQGTATDTGIALTWTQDDFQTLMGYNVYRSTKEDGLYTRLNKTVIPADTMEWFDDTVEPGVVYYYNFTVVQTDMAESEPSGKIVIMSKDTMAPNIYHSPVSSAFTGSNLVLTATVTDNLNIAYANLYYRVAGTEEWSTIRMNKLNDKYSAIIPAAAVTVEGIEYYIEAFDGISYTYKGSAQTPFTIAVQEALDENSLGDVDGDGVITNLDALLLLYTINDKYNMTAEQFARADLNGDGDLWAAEALRILQYVSGVIGSVKM